jgi:hypothetical protein
MMYSFIKSKFISHKAFDGGAISAYNPSQIAACNDAL